MRIELTYKEMQSIVKMFGAVPVSKDIVIRKPGEIKLIEEILSDATENKKNVIFQPNLIFQGETVSFILTIDDDRFLTIISALKENSNTPIAAKTFVQLFLASVGSLKEQIVCVIGNNSEQTDNFMKEHQQDTIEFLLWKKRKEIKRARFSTLQ